MDETDTAARTAAFLGTDHARVHVSGQDVRDRLPAIAAALDQPSVDGVNAYFVSAAAGGKVKVAISGTGGDELFAGYPWFAAMADAAPRLHGPGLWPGLRRMASQLATGPLEHVPYGLAARVLGRVRASGDFLETFSRQYRIFGTHCARQLLAPDLSAALGATPPDRMRAAAADELPEADVIARVSALCLRGYTQNQLLRDIDAVSMAHSLEIRVPFLDPAVVDFALSLPDRSKLKSGAAGDAAYRESGAKRILLDATRDLLPPGIENQQKRGFGMPFGAWLRGPLREILDDTTATHIVRARGLFNPVLVEQTRREFLSGRGSWALPWTLMMVELWCRGVLDAPARAAPTP
jgi:asparagine synthase (glutamine-hydrolysing)